MSDLDIPGRQDYNSEGKGALPRMSVPRKMAYGSGGMAYAVKDAAFINFVLFFYTQVVGLDPRYASLALLIAMIWDAVSDPLIGSISDNFKSRWGRRHPFMIVGGLPWAITFLFLFRPPEGGSDFATFLWLLVISIILRTFLTIYIVPHASLAAELTSDYDERSSIVGWRTAMGWWCGLLMPFMGYAFFFVERDGQYGLMIAENYWGYGVLSCCVVAVTTTIATVFTLRYIPDLPKASRHAKTFDLVQLFSDIRLALKNYNFRVMFLLLLTMGVSGGVTAAAGLYMNAYFWEFSTVQLSWLVLASVPGILIALRLVNSLGKRFEKHKLIQYTALGFVLNGLWLVPARLLGIAPENGTDMIFILVMINNVVGAMMVMIFQVMTASLIADIADEHDLSTGRRQEGVFFAAQGFAFKSVTGFGTVIMGYVLTYANLTSDAVPGTVEPDVLFKMGLIVGPILALTFLVPYIFSRRFTLSRARHAEILKTLGQRRLEALQTEEG